MDYYRYSNIIGNFIFDENIKIVAKKEFKSFSEYEKREKVEKDLLKKHKKAAKPSTDVLKKILEVFKDPKHYSKFKERNTLITKQAIKESVCTDNFIMQTISNINDIDKTSNLMVKRLRDWYKLYLPELEKDVDDHEKFAQLISTKTKKELLKDLKLKEVDSMGGNLGKEDLNEITLLAKQIYNTYQLRHQHEKYLEKIMKKYCPNLLEVAGVTIGAKLFEHAKSLRHLALLPSSTIQLYGAEKALFRHIKTGAPSPKYGIIFTHPFVVKARRKNQGRAARVLASKISMAVKIDFFKGKFIGDKLKKELDKKAKDFR